MFGVGAYHYEIKTVLGVSIVLIVSIEREIVYIVIKTH